MALSHLDGTRLPAPADFHVHLRDGAMMELVTPMIRLGGANTVFVMPNLIPPVTTVAQALAYKSRLVAVEPNVTYLMSLYLHPSITPQVVREAAAAGVAGIKSYPAGVTTNSSSGVVSYEQFYPVFEEMEKCDLVLNLHGEVPSTADNHVTVLNAEESFLPTLLDLHRRFPKLRIVLEHCTTAAAVAAVKACGPNVVATITAHHLFLIVDDWAGDPHSFCKPVAKLPSDREMLLQTAASGHGKFFLGTDSAPHPAISKRGDKVAAGVFTQPYAIGHVLGAFEQAVERGVLTQDHVNWERLVAFTSANGRAFYKTPSPRAEEVVLHRHKSTVPAIYASSDAKIEVVPFRRGLPTWSTEWV